MQWLWDGLRIVEMVFGLIAVGLSVATAFRKAPLARHLRFLALASFCGLTAVTAIDRLGEVPTVPYRLVTDAILCIIASVACLAYYWEPRTEPAPSAGDIEDAT